MEREHPRQSWQKVVGQLQLTALLAVVFGIGLFFGSQYESVMAQNGGRIQLSEEAEEAFQPLFQTYNLIEEQYIDEIDVTALVDGALRGMVETLDDPYSGYVDAESFRFVSDDLSGEVEGIGVVISENEETGNVEIANVLNNTPADLSGLEEGDVFYAVDGEDVLGLTYLELAARVRGQQGTIVNLIMQRDGELLEFAIERARIEVPNIEAELLDDNIAYIKMSQFNGIARSQVDEALASFDIGTLDGLIFDLRGNPGGFLSTATEIAGLFLENGVILTEEFGDGDVHSFEIRDGDVYEVFQDGDERLYSQNAEFGRVAVPVVILIDERSASASELVAGAWQVHEVATIIGTTSFGKGTVQIQNELVNGGGVRLTVARWLTPDGNWISGKGITPDIVVELPEDFSFDDGYDPQLEAAVQFLTLGEVNLPEVTQTEME